MKKNIPLIKACNNLERDRGIYCFYFPKAKHTIRVFETIEMRTLSCL